MNNAIISFSQSSSGGAQVVISLPIYICTDSICKVSYCLGLGEKVNTNLIQINLIITVLFIV